MEGEQVDSSSDQNARMFAKLQPRPPHPRRASFQPDPANDTRQAIVPVTLSDAGDGATIEVVRRRRGRPPGSKNKPKPPIIITRDSDPPMSPHILEVPGGADIIAAVSRFSRRRNLSLCVLAASGAAANVTLRQPSATSVTFHGRFDILSLSATCLPPSAPEDRFSISLAGPQGQIVGGIVSGALLAAGTVYVIAASLNNPSYHRLPIEEESGESAPVHTEPNSLPADVMWSSASRQPPPLPHPQPPY